MKTSLLGDLKARLPDGDRLYALLGICAIAVVVIGHAIITATAIVPGVRSWRELTARVESAQGALADAQVAQARAPEMLRQKLEAAEARRSEAANKLVSEALASEIPTRLYQYASESGVEIVSLQSQAAKNGADKELYSISGFDLQAVGAFPGLVGFVSRIKEAGQKGFVISNVSIVQKDQDRHSLTMGVTLYTSPWAGAPAEAGMGVIPAPPPATPEPAAPLAPAPIVYTVRSGDTLWGIALHYGVSIEGIMAANGLQSSDVQSGQELLIPAP